MEKILNELKHCPKCGLKNIPNNRVRVWYYENPKTGEMDQEEVHCERCYKIDVLEKYKRLGLWEQVQALADKWGLQSKLS